MPRGPSLNPRDVLPSAIWGVSISPNRCDGLVLLPAAGSRRADAGGIRRRGVARGRESPGSGAAACVAELTRAARPREAAGLTEAPKSGLRSVERRESALADVADDMGRNPLGITEPCAPTKTTPAPERGCPLDSSWDAGCRDVPRGLFAVEDRVDPSTSQNPGLGARARRV